MTSQPSRAETTFDFVVVSNRLPVKQVRDEQGGISWQRSPGGLVTALEPVVRSNHGAWVGWPGIPDVESKPFSSDGLSLVPVYMTPTELQEYYEGFANGTLWPLYHDVIAAPVYSRTWWRAYAHANRRFAEATARAGAPGAAVWVQDYQLQLVPRMLREMRPDLTIGFFNHIPFPPYGLFAQLPWREQIIDGLLGADVIGFQRSQDARNFATAVRRLFGWTMTRNRIEVAETARGSKTRTVIVQDYPISIDAASYDELARSDAVRDRAEKIRQNLGDPKHILLGVDRLDYTKGIGHRINAFSELLAEGRIAVEDVAFIQIASPSREHVDSYMQLRDQIETVVGHINGEYSTMSHSAITYLHQNYSREELVALFLISDVLLVTSLRDGMNLVAKEYVAARCDRRGVLVLSEFTGAADELKHALTVNPHDTDGLKDTIMQALTMGHPEQSRRMQYLRSYVFRNDVTKWASNFLGDLTSRSSGEARL